MPGVRGPGDDHLRTRLTHAIEVCQVAVSIARPVRLDTALTAAAATGYDWPRASRHASEGARSPFLDDGYHHAVSGAALLGLGRGPAAPQRLTTRPLRRAQVLPFPWLEPTLAPARTPSSTARPFRQAMPKAKAPATNALRASARSSIMAGLISMMPNTRRKNGGMMNAQQQPVVEDPLQRPRANEVTDRTTWSASVVGDPVHLSEEEAP